MKKVTVTLPEANGGSWGGVKTNYPKDSSKVKFVDFTGSSKNFDTDNNAYITKRLGGINFNSSTFTSAPKDAYEAVFANGTRHLLAMQNGSLMYSSGGGVFNTVTAGYTSTGNMEFASYQDRVYFGNGIDSPQSYDITTVYGGVTYVAPKTKVMGAQAPGSAPTAVLVVTGTGNVPLVAHTYKVTYLYYGSQESNGSTASGVVTPDGTHKQVTVTIPVGGYGVSARKVYRDDNDGNWLLLGTVSDNTTTTFTDNYSTGTSAVPTDNGLPPLGKLWLQFLDRIWCSGVSASSSYVFFSDPGLPDIFPSLNYVLCNPKDPVIGMIEYATKILIFNRNSMGWILGKTKDTFRYESIPSTVGCVDNRSIQIRTSKGVPTVVWLSDKGLYEFNGSSINYISIDIADQLNLNIQQAVQVKGKNTQDTQADFLAGTPSAGITVTVGGTVTQSNPKKVYQAKVDWDAGSSLTNCDTVSNPNSLQAVTRLVGDFSTGTHSNDLVSGSNITLNTGSSFTGQDNTGATECRYFNNGGVQEYAQQFSPSSSGTLTALSIVWNGRFETGTGRFKVYSDGGGGPSSVLYTGSNQVTNSGSGQTITQSGVSLSLSGGSKYWIAWEILSTSGGTGGDSTSSTLPGPRLSASSAFTSVAPQRKFSGSYGTIPVISGTVAPQSMDVSYTYSQVAVAATGQWTSLTWDTGASSITTSLILTHTGSYPSGTSGTSYIEGSSDGSTFDVSYSAANLNGAVTQTVSSRRYWRIRLVIATSDDRTVPTAGTPILTFGTTATWFSAAIDHTADITALNALTSVNSVPAGCSLNIAIATSDDNVTYTGYTVVGSATAKRYSKVRITLTTPAANDVTPVVTSCTLTWTVVSTHTSSIIDTGSLPAGWELFTVDAGTTGTITYQVRTASTSGGIPGAGWTTVTSGTYIPNTVYEFIQWRATLTATADNVPSLFSVVTNWFISNINSIRVSSLFYGLNYYLAAAEYGQTSNNIVIKLEDDGDFKFYRDLNVNVFTRFFSDVYYGKSSEGRFVKWFSAATDQGTNITMDIQSAAINYGDLEHNKILRKVYVTGKNTGTVITPQYSTDNGTTWKSMVNPLTGLSTYTTTSDGNPFKARFQPVFASDNATGPSHILRLISSDANDCQIYSVKFEAWVRMGEPS